MLKVRRKYGSLEGYHLTPKDPMQITAEKILNPYNYHLSFEAKKRLRWMYLLYFVHEGNVTRTAIKIGVSRQWLSTLNTTFERHHKDPRSLEPQSKAPHDTRKRKRISLDTESAIVATRTQYGWGKAKIAAYLKNTLNVVVHPNTVNTYLHKHAMITPKLSLKNSKAWQQKKLRDSGVIFKVKYRPPAKIKDYAPGALVEKDMKYLVKPGANHAVKRGENFRYQQTAIDSFTRLRVLEVTEDFESTTTAQAHRTAVKRFPFKVACMNTDNGSENGKEFTNELQTMDIFHFYSNTATPTDNPRVERSHLTDDVEFYGKGNIYKDLARQKEAVQKWEDIYNLKRPHQALGYLTPMDFYALWKKDPKKAYAITEQWRVYLRKQKIRLSASRRIKRQEQIESLMNFIDAKTANSTNLLGAKLQLINCQLCSMA